MASTEKKRLGATGGQDHYVHDWNDAHGWMPAVLRLRGLQVSSARESQDTLPVAAHVVYIHEPPMDKLVVKTAHALKIREPHVITVTGKAFYDIGHAPADHSNRRSTPKGYAVWEIHPVMKMDMIP
jgi:hypothetical protein